MTMLGDEERSWNKERRVTLVARGSQGELRKVYGFAETSGSSAAAVVSDSRRRTKQSAWMHVRGNEW